MTYLSNLKEIESEIEKCMQCGNCQAVCPLYEATRSEPAVARGKVQMAKAILEGTMPYSEGAKHVFETCLTCRACVENCPTNTQVDKIVLAARAAMVQQKGLPVAKRLIFNALAHPNLFKMGMAIGGQTQGIFFKKVSDEGMRLRIPVSGLQLKRMLPSLAKKSFLSVAAEEYPVANPKFRVLFFAGCTTNFIYPGAAEAVIEVMKANDVSVIVPKAQHCCGFPIMAHGDTETLKLLARSNIDTYRNYEADAIITICGTCGEAWETYYPELLKDDPEYGEVATEMAHKTKDIADFMVNILHFDRSKLGPVDRTVTYHEPCHIGRGMGVGKEQLELIQAIPGIKFNPMKDANRCCGGAGSFSLTHYDLSQKVLGQKIENIRNAEAETVVTPCGSCRMQLNEGLIDAGLEQNVIHTVQLLAESYRNAKK